jgi:hypothetical protein
MSKQKERKGKKIYFTMSKKETNIDLRNDHSYFLYAVLVAGAQ